MLEKKKEFTYKTYLTYDDGRKICFAEMKSKQIAFDDFTMWQKWLNEKKIRPLPIVVSLEYSKAF